LLSKKEPNPMVDALVAFAHSPDGQKILDAEGYTPLEQKK
jgi:ABC-type phosphate transport system substrate-binding protein